MTTTKPSDYLSNCVRPDAPDVPEQVLMIMTVRTVDGVERRHTYPLPPGYETCMQQWNAALSAVHQAIESHLPLILTDPTAVYNGSHIASVEFSFAGTAAIVDRIKGAHRALGFRYEDAVAGTAGPPAQG